MLNLFDMLAQAQNGSAIDQMARQYGLTQAQVQDAMAALMPAFSQGLKRNAANPYDLSSFLQALSSGQHAQYFEDATRAFSQQGINEGNGILGHLFGSKDLSRAVAAQAAQATGIGQEVLKQMLPALATMIMGGLFKQSVGQSTGQTNAAAGFGGQGNPLQEIIEQMMRQGGMPGQSTPRPQAPQPQANQFDNPLGQILEGMFGGGKPRERAPQAPQSPFGDNPLGKIFEEMMRGGQTSQQTTRSRPEPTPDAQTRQKPQPRTNPSGRARTPYDDLFGDMFESGARTRESYQKNMESIFDQFLSGMEKRRR